MEHHQLIEYFMCIVGPIGALFGVPQVIRLYHRKTSEDISMVSYTAWVFLSICWLFYGVAMDLWPLIISSVIALMMNLTILVFCLAYRQFVSEPVQVEEATEDDGSVG